MVETVIFDYISPHCDPQLEHSKPIFLHDTLAYDDASPYQVSLQKGRQLKKYHPDEHSLEIFNLSCDHDPQQSNPIFSQDNPAYDDEP